MRLRVVARTRREASRKTPVVVTFLVVESDRHEAVTVLVT